VGYGDNASLLKSFERACHPIEMLYLPIQMCAAFVERSIEFEKRNKTRCL
jgi:hypothetical protein